LLLLVRQGSEKQKFLCGKPHLMEFCYRTGGEVVYVCRRRRSGVTAHEYQRLLADVPGAKAWGWRSMRRNPSAFLRGRVRHVDHKTIVLHGWHRVFMNTEDPCYSRASAETMGKVVIKGAEPQPEKWRATR
jgi:hypothetical protein